MRDPIEHMILSLHKNALQENRLTVDERIDFFSKQFIGKPYLNGAQGEGELGEFDQSPLYRFDCFDCVSYVNNVLALAFSDNIDSFRKKLLQLNYYDAIPVYENRFHFMSIDWNSNNQKNNFLYDVTKIIKNKKGGVIAQIASGEVNKPEWFRKKTIESIKLHQPINDNQKKIVLRKLHDKSHLFQKQSVNISYLPLHTLFDLVRLEQEFRTLRNPFCTIEDFQGEESRFSSLSANANLVRAQHRLQERVSAKCETPIENQFIFSQFPTVSVIEIVRPNWNLKDKIGTHLHVSHIGFAIRNSSHELRFRHASSEQRAIVDVSMIEYLKNCSDNPTIKGINIQKINEKALKINRT